MSARMAGCLIAAFLVTSSPAYATVIHTRGGGAITLHGDYEYDAESPDGATVYVIHYLSRDHTHYAVQWLDAGASHPVPTTVVEKGEPGEKMAGHPLSRANAGDWVYTLYDGAGETPFVHALDTAERVTVCIDLDDLAGRNDLSTLALRARPRENRLDVTTADGRPLLHVDTDSYAVLPARRAPPAAAAERDHERVSAGSIAPMGGIAIAVAALAGVLAGVRTRRRRRAVS